MAMIRPETEMKDSGDVYIGKMPLNWRLASYKYFADSGMGLTILKEDVTDLGVPIYSATQDSSIFGYINNPKLKLNKGDLVIPARGNSIGCTTYVEDDIATCTQTTIYSKVSGINPKFLFYCSIGLKEEWFYYVKTAIPQITVSQVQNNKVPLPLLSEQQAIADYLDETCSKIDEIIAEAKASIDEYKELKQSVIFEAVTKGLDKNVEMKDSGIEWIGEIPVGWVVKKFKYVATVNTNLVSPIGYEDYHQIAPDCIEKDSGRIIKERTVSEAGIESWNQLFKQGQLIYSKIRPTLNKVIIAPYDGLCSADMYPLDVHENIYFVQFAMLSKYFVGQVSLITQDRVKMPKINQDELSNVYVAVPEKTEQKKLLIG